MKITHQKREFVSCPPQIGIWYKPEKKQWECVFDGSAKYIQPVAEEQWDWLKLCGIAFTINAQKESAMIGWRYLPLTNEFEFNAYCHINGERKYTEPLVKIKNKGTVLCTIRVHYDMKIYVIEIESGDMKQIKLVPFTHNKKWAREVQSWFGGTLPAPVKISFIKNKIL